jgi:hypothetical protein
MDSRGIEYSNCKILIVIIPVWSEEILELSPGLIDIEELGLIKLMIEIISDMIGSASINYPFIVQI